MFISICLPYNSVSKDTTLNKKKKAIGFPLGQFKSAYLTVGAQKEVFPPSSQRLPWLLLLVVRKSRVNSAQRGAALADSQSE